MVVVQFKSDGVRELVALRKVVHSLLVEHSAGLLAPSGSSARNVASASATSARLRAALEQCFAANVACSHCAKQAQTIWYICVTCTAEYWQSRAGAGTTQTTKVCQECFFTRSLQPKHKEHAFLFVRAAGALPAPAPAAATPFTVATGKEEPAAERKAKKDEDAFAVADEKKAGEERAPDNAASVAAAAPAAAAAAALSLSFNELVEWLPAGFGGKRAPPASIRSDDILSLDALVASGSKSTEGKATLVAPAEPELAEDASKKKRAKKAKQKKDDSDDEAAPKVMRTEKQKEKRDKDSDKAERDVLTQTQASAEGQDQLLDEMSTGLANLKSLAVDVDQELRTQDAQVRVADDKVNRAARKPVAAPAPAAAAGAKAGSAKGKKADKVSEPEPEPEKQKRQCMSSK